MLARRLVVEGMPIQRVIGDEAGVSQSTVSRAIHGRLGQTPGARKLWDYAAERQEILATERLIDGDGMVPTPAERSGVRARRRDRIADEHSRAVVPARGKRHQELERRAVEGLQDYLADRFDPLLVIEQLAVLRRAQDSARRARPERRQRAARRKAGA